MNEVVIPIDTARSIRHDAVEGRVPCKRPHALQGQR
jgi:hypothetical protein